MTGVSFDGLKVKLQFRKAITRLNQIKAARNKLLWRLKVICIIFPDLQEKTENSKFDANAKF